MNNPLRKMHMEHSWLSKNELIDECAELRVRVAELEEVIADTHRLYLHLAEDSNVRIFEFEKVKFNYVKDLLGADKDNINQILQGI